MRAKSFLAAFSFVLAASVPIFARADAAAPDYNPLAMEAGKWDVVVTFFDPDGKAAGSAKGTQTNVLLRNGHWITNDLVVRGKAVFQGHGVWGWDPVARQYVDTWVDTNDGAVRTDYGFWNAAEQTMYWSALQPDGAGHSVNVRMTEHFEGAHRTLTFYQVALQSGRLVKLAEMSFTKRS